MDRHIREAWSSELNTSRIVLIVILIAMIILIDIDNITNTHANDGDNMESVTIISRRARPGAARSTPAWIHI